MSDTCWVRVGRLLCVATAIAGCSAAGGDEPAALGSAGSTTPEGSGGSSIAGTGGTTTMLDAAGIEPSSNGGGGGSIIGGSGSGTGGTANAGGSGGSVVVDGGGRVGGKCKGGASNGLAGGAPALTPGVWKDISPPGVPYGQDGTIALGVAVDPCNPLHALLMHHRIQPGHGEGAASTRASTEARPGAASVK